MKRRKLLELGAAAALLPLLPRDVEACEGNRGAAAQAAPASSPLCDRMVARVGTNHGHVFEVSVADVTAGVEKTYDLTGAAGHAHSVTLSAEHWKQLRSGAIVRLPSTRDGHLHRLLVRCAPAVDPPETVSVCKVEIGGKDDHDLVITAADIAAKTDKTYDIQGIAAHTHAVKISGADFERLARGEALTLTSTAGDGHTHVAFVRLAAKTKTG